MVTYQGCTCGDYYEGCIGCGHTYSYCECKGDYNEGCLTCSKSKDAKGGKHE